MKKFVLLLIATLLLLNSTLNTYATTNNNTNSIIDYSYSINGKVFYIYYPENIEYLEYCYYSEQCKVDTKYKKLIKLNSILIKKGFKSIW